MRRRVRITLIVAGSIAAALVLLLVAAILILRSAWFHEKVRQRIVTEVERSTGGKAGAGKFTFNWRNQTAEIRNFVLRGNEPAGSPPLASAESVQIQLNVQSILKQQVNLESLNVYRPEFHLIVYPDGTTNIPKPKVSTSKKNPVETILDLAIKHLRVEYGVVTINSERKPPFNILAEDVNARFDYAAAGPAYHGELVSSPLYLTIGDRPRLPVNVAARLTLERNRINVTGADLTTRGSDAKVTGTITDLSHPSGDFRYDADVNLSEIGPYLKLPGQEQGTAHMTGSLTFGAAPVSADPMQFKLSGNLRMSNWNYSMGNFRLRNFRVSSAYTLSAGVLDLSGVRFAGLVYPDLGLKVESLPVEGRIRAASVETARKNVDVKDLALSTLGGTFDGNVDVTNFARFRVSGDVHHFDLRRAMALVSAQTLPYDALISGPVRVEGTLARKGPLVATARLNISPAPGTEPVSGLIEARYDRAGSTLDLGQSYVNLPRTHLAFSGILGRQLRVHLDSTNLNELAPLVNTAIPIQLQNGRAVFDGMVTGSLSAPHITGQAGLSNFVYSGERFDSFHGAIVADPNLLQVENASLARGTLNAQFQARVGLSNWKPVPGSPVTVEASVRNAGLADLLALAGRPNIPASGTLNTTVRVSGTVGNPQVAADLHVANGKIFQQPFDRLEATLGYSNQLLEVSTARLVSGPNEIALKASYRHLPGDFETGTLEFQVASDRLTLAQLQLVTQYRPGLAGALQINAVGRLAVSRTPAGPKVRIESLSARIAAQGLHLGKQAFGDLLLNAYTKGNELFATFQSDFAGANVRGNGQWRLTDGYPGKAEITFSRIDLNTVRQWISTGQAAALSAVNGYAQGSLAISGPLFSPADWTAALTLPTVEISPVRQVQLVQNAPQFSFRNQGPVELTMSKLVVQITSAHFVAMGTNIAVTGKVDLKRNTPLDLQIKGRVDLATLQNFNKDLYASGFVIVDAGIRGALHNPQVVGQLQLKNASFNLATLPNGISSANGVIQFSGNRASIQSLTAESGGGKLSLRGFAAYQGGEFVFRAEAEAKEVRVRYPEGVSTTADARLVLTGTSQHSILSGTVTVTRTGFTPNVDFTSILTKSAEPVRTPPARTGFLAGMQLDIQVETAPDIIFQSSLAQGVQLQANLRLRGTATNPALLGRIVILQGELLFFGTKYTIDQGSVNFYNPVRIEPVLNIDLQTRVRGIDVILTVSGTLNKLTITPRSDPPLQFSEIVALLTTGSAPGANPATLQMRESTIYQSWQQMGASALLGQALANPVSGRLQRFFGVTRLKIDPLISGVENNPQARLTIEQQITPQVTFTYITDVTRTNPLVVRVEWAINKTWSAVALRDESGIVGLDFLYKKRF